MKTQSFSVDPKNLKKVTKKLIDVEKKIELSMKTKMDAVITLVWTTARAKRKMYTSPAGKRVSDPMAAFGVPVKTGALQGSIERQVIEHPFKVSGEVWTNGIPYARKIEFGWSGHQQPRPFMHESVQLNREKMRKIFRATSRSGGYET